MKQIAAAFVKAQKAFGPALKTNTNPHFKSKYAGLDACVEAVIDGLNDNGIALLQNSHECSDGVIVETMFLHESGEFISAGKLHVPASKNDAQGYGSALTYARRYSLMAACGIAPEDDDGNAASKAPKASVTALPASAKSVSADVWESLTDEERQFLRPIAANAAAMIDESRVAEAIAYIQKQNLDADEKVALNSQFSPAQRAAMKKAPKPLTESEQLATQA